MNVKTESLTQLLSFLDASPTPFHAVDALRNRLNAFGFEELLEQESWKIHPGSKYFVVRGDTSIAAWIQGTESPSVTGFRLIGAHTDSPNLRIKPQPDLNQHGYLQFGVEVYGGALLSSWADRDLSLAGMIYLKNKTGKIEGHLLHHREPLLRIPLLAIHLNRDVNEKGLVLNAQTHLPPVYGLEDNEDSGKGIHQLLAGMIECQAEDILSYDLSLYDTQPASTLGQNQEFIVSGRLDNLYSCFSAVEALLEDQHTPSPQTRMAVCFDHEEIGSMTTQGARSSFITSLLKRLNQENDNDAYERSCARSMLISADMAHAVHPNFSEKHEPQHFPQINGGPVIKINAQGRYATSGSSEALFEQICREKEIPVQKFVNRTDLSCGSTIGPFVAGNLGVPTLDVGSAMLSMHSVREMAGSNDVGWMIEAFRGFYTRPALD